MKFDLVAQFSVDGDVLKWNAYLLAYHVGVIVGDSLLLLGSCDVIRARLTPFVY